MRYSSLEHISTKHKSWDEIAPGLRRQFLGYNESIMMLKIKFDKDAIGAKHSHFHSQTTYIESGVFEVTIGDKTEVLIKGDGFFVPPNIEHGVICNEPGMLIDVFTPIREDFFNIGGKKQE